MATKKLQILDSIISTDTTLTKDGVAADAKAVGDAINNFNGVLITTDDIDTICGADIQSVDLTEGRFNE